MRQLAQIIFWFYNKLSKQTKVFLLLMIVCWGLISARPTSYSKAAELSIDIATDSLLCMAHRLEGVPYRYGGKNENGFDCSGYTRYLYQQLGINLNASAAEQYKQGKVVHIDSLQQGDLVFFRHTNGRIFHVGMYVGERENRSAFIHASSSRGVVVDQLEQRYYRERWAGARRIFSS